MDKIRQCLAIVHTHNTVRRFLPPLPWMMARNVVFYTNKVWRIAVKHTGGLSLGLLLPSCRPLFRPSLLPPYRAVGTGGAKGSNANPDFGNISKTFSFIMPCITLLTRPPGFSNFPTGLLCRCLPSLNSCLSLKTVRSDCMFSVYYAILPKAETIWFSSRV